jgi:hypothetical protein
MTTKQPTAGRGTTALLREEIARQASGSVFTTQDLLAGGRLGTSRSALDIALKRLVDEGQLVRAGRGVFAVPERHDVLGNLPPKLESVAAAIARRSGDTMLPGGAESANRLGLSTQVPGRPVFYTTGRASRRVAGTQRYELRHRTPRLAKADTQVVAVIEALRTLGKSRANDRSVIRQVQRSLSDSDKARLRAQAHLGPGWMQPILRRIATSNQDSDSTTSLG